MQDIILLHGAIGAADQLQPLAQALSTKGFKVHALSFSGHGGEPFQELFGIEQFAAELYQFIIEKNLDQPHLFGYSMGGYVGLYLAAQKEQLLGKIATLATKFDWTPEGARKESAMLDPETLQQKVPQFAEALQKRHGEEQWEALLARTADMMHTMGAQPPLGEAVYKAIKLPVLLGIGDKDSMVTVDETRAVLSQLPKANMFMLPSVKHPIETVPAELLATILVHFYQAN
ncbi:MAG TPA: alpha/beta fold hydrolase [Chitinophagaceae bacterium]|nr:alpha/beta fold hydrolase [Chitinophagaceae bacterium]